MLRQAVYLCVFTLSLTIAQAETAKNYFGTAAIIDATLDYDSERLADVAIDTGFILSYGRTITENSAFEASYVRYIDMSSFGGEVSSEVTALEFSGVFSMPDAGPFLRLGFSGGDLKTRLFDLSRSESESGPLIGIGMTMPIAENKAAIRFEYNAIRYDNADAERLTIGTLVRF